MLVFATYIVCALTTPTVCHRTWPPPVVLRQHGLAACEVSLMRYAPTWTENHPGWFIKSMDCTPGSPPPAGDEA